MSNKRKAKNQNDETFQNKNPKMTQFFFPIGNDEIEDVRNMELNQDNVKSDNNKNLKTKEECVILN